MDRQTLHGTSAGLALLDLSLPDPAANLALDEALLLAAELGTGSEVLRFWEAPAPMVVLGAGGSVQIDVNRTACEAAGVRILRRASGGGTVLLGPGCLGFSLVLRTDHAPGLSLIQPSTRFVLNRILSALHAVVPEATIAGTSDLALGSRKFSGNAQQRKRSYFLHHGTLLYRFDLGSVVKILNAPERQPEYRQDRNHEAFLMNLPATAVELKQALIQEWSANREYTEVPLAAVEQLVAEKYSQDEWTFRR